MIDFEIDEVLDCLAGASCIECKWCVVPFRIKWNGKDKTEQFIKCGINKEMKAYKCESFGRKNV